jgi:hypothetical protein
LRPSGKLRTAAATYAATPSSATPTGRSTLTTAMSAARWESRASAAAAALPARSAT